MFNIQVASFILFLLLVYFAVIVDVSGPPGTGKTYVGLKIVETLLYNLYHVPCQEAPKSGKHRLTYSCIYHSSSMMTSYLYYNRRIHVTPRSMCCSVPDRYQLCFLLFEELVNTFWTTAKLVDIFSQKTLWWKFVGEDSVLPAKVLEPDISCMLH